MFDDDLRDVAEPERLALQALIAQVHAAAPDAVEGRSYGLPAFTYRDKPLLGFSVRRSHLSVHPFSAEVVAAVRPQLDGFDCSKGTIRFTAEQPLPPAAVDEMVRLRKAEIDGAGAG